MPLSMQPVRTPPPPSFVTSLSLYPAPVLAGLASQPVTFRMLTQPPTEHEDDIVRRDSLHGIINSLPDPNYATLRAMTLHLYRVMDNSHVNRMNSHNLAVIFGPTLMGSDPSTAITDAGWQIKVIDTILQNTYQIFDED